MSLITQGGHYEWTVVNGANTYGKANISSGTLSDGVYEKIGIGNVVARQLDIKLWNVTADTSSPLVLTVDAYNIDGTHTTKNKGTYYIDTAATSPYSEYTEITAYDAMLKTEVPFMKGGTFVTTTDKAVVEEIATAIGVNIESNTAAILASPKTINEVPSIGDNGTTMREMLSVVATMRGGNFIINDDGELELVSLLGKYDVARVVTLDSNGDFELIPYSLLESADEVISLDANGDFQAVAFSTVTDSTELWFVDGDGNDYSDTWANIQVLAPIPYPALTVGNEVAKFDVSPTETITRVELWAGSSTSYRSPEGLTEAEWDALGGIILSANMPLMASQSLADALYTLYNGYTYVPYTADKAYFDPAVPLGTSLEIKNDTVLLTSRSLKIGNLGFSNLSAGATAAVVSYYPKMTPVERSLERDITENRTAIEVQEGQINSIVQTFNEELGVNITELTAHNPTDIYNASTNPNGYWRESVVNRSVQDPEWVTQLSDGWYHIEGSKSNSVSPFIRFEPKAIPSLDAETLTLLMEIRNASYTGTGNIKFQNAPTTSGIVKQYLASGQISKPTDGKYYITLTKSASADEKTVLFSYGTNNITVNGTGLSLDIRLSLYVGAYDGNYVPWSGNSYNSRVQQTADGILISLASKITEAEAQQLVDAYGEVVEQYLRFAAGVLELGETNSQFKALLSNTKLAFTGADGREVAWISNSQLFISEAVLNGALTIRANAYATTSWRQYVRESDNIFCIKVVKPNA